MIAYRIEESLRCGMCGTADWEWDPAQGGSKYAYAPDAKYCPGCYAKHMAGEDESLSPGTTIVLTKLSPVEKAKRQVLHKIRAKKRREKEKREKERIEAAKRRDKPDTLN